MDGTIGGALRYWGLSYIPDLGDDNSLQFYKDKFGAIANKIAPKDYFSLKNRQLLFKCLLLLNLDIDGYGTILEIGIGKKERWANTSTAVILNTKSSYVKYIGIDVEKRNWVLGKGNNIYLYNDLSENVLEKVDKEIRIDLLHLDGSHSVNGILRDWEFTQLVQDTGIILLHDIKVHPGPMELVKAIDRDIYTVHEMFMDDPKDFGMAVIYKKENNYDTICS